ncbi:alpha-N-acetylglucosaminidase [Goodfellowiella coeruleoviolacea]|uniref:NPCBM-associated, NEW3 domain of alpha-galactosidase n=1 Tax=Goodfellowiella coeruleoviolacea TaxID=334858 RepID=A0AAE3GH40_9PSEU|nr:alpha-N-acetylglucosaminidase TIM-barrel domain-containing protein [Goodfellowiella coeruleoviolacea]MCP2168055.1 NPCBM-associated, NEW3 domain of alpha-galactosidase [Goodfellowiella coeruleoviolacea]
MRRTLLAVVTLATLLLCLAQPAAAQPGSGAADGGNPDDATVATEDTTGQAFAVLAVRATLRRLLPAHANQIRLLAVPGGGDRATVTGQGGRVVVTGTSPVALLNGVNAYLNEVVGASVSWAGEQLNLPDRLPVPGTDIVRQSTVAHRFALNDTNDGYTGPYWDWSRWEHEIDVLAMHGINEVLVYAGSEAVLYETFRQFGYTDPELRDWIPGIAHQPWWLLQNMCCFGGTLSKQNIEERAALGRRIVDRLRELGMTPVLPGYFGTVPPSFDLKNSGARVIPQGDWGGFPRPDWLDPRNAYFPAVANAFYSAQRRLFGDTTMYKMDLLHEGGNPGDVPIGTAARTVERALQTAHPGATWAILGWQENPRQELLAPLNKSRTLILDGVSDRYDNLDRERNWPNTPYTFGTIPNFGGHTALGANLSIWNKRYWEWKNKPGSNLRGIAIMPEAGDNNPLAFDFFTDLAWQRAPQNLSTWFANWTRSRYGAADPHAAAAWDELRRSVYDPPLDGWSEPQDSLFSARPSLDVTSAASWSPQYLRYDPAAVERALSHLVAVPARLRDSDAYHYDVVDVARQALANRSRALLPQIRSAYLGRDQELFTDLTTTWLHWMDRLEEITGTDTRFMLGPWLAQTANWADSPEERAEMEYDARSLLTVWGTRRSSDIGLHDYANREWSGLISGLYKPRWERYFAELASAMADVRQPSPIDWYEMDEAWARTATGLPTTPTGDPGEVAAQVLAELRADPHQAVISVTPQPLAAKPGEPVEISVTLRNLNAFVPATNVSLKLSLPFAVPTTPNTTPAVAVGGSFTAKWRVTLPVLPNGSPVLRLSAEATFGFDDQEGHASGRTAVLAANGVSSPLHTVSFNSASFGQTGERIAIAGGGRDMWEGTNEFGAAYLARGMVDGATATTAVLSQDQTGAWARAGLVVRNSLAANGSGGYLNLAITPANGCVLSWDNNGDGNLEANTSVGGFSAPVRLKLTRTGKRFTAWCGTPDTWTEVGTVEIDADTQQDVGVFMSAVNGGSGATGIAEFTGFQVSLRQ